MTGFDPDYPPALVRASPNFGPRRGGASEPRRPDMILLHYTGMDTAKGALERLCDTDAEVSAHYLIDEGGIVTQMVPESHRAWHAGKSYWKGEADVNSASIGIEIANKGHEAGRPAYPVIQMRAVARLCRDIIARHEIAPDRVLGHSDVSIGRKIDPGEWFDWAWLAAEGVGEYGPRVDEECAQRSNASSEAKDDQLEGGVSALRVNSTVDFAQRATAFSWCFCARGGGTGATIFVARSIAHDEGSVT